MKACKRCNHGEEKHNEKGVCFAEVQNKENPDIMLGCPCNKYKA